MNTENDAPRLIKVLAQAGIGSRREMEALIARGEITVGGAPAITGQRYEQGQVVCVRGKVVPLGVAGLPRVWRFHKPKGFLVTTHDPRGRPTIFDLIPPEMPRVVTVGRLDYNSEGLLLLTTSGALARHLELPSTGWKRCYRVRAHGLPTPRQIEMLAAGITAQGIHYGAIEVVVEKQQATNVWLRVTLAEGKNREIRNVMEAIGCPVTRLIRIAFGGFQLGSLPLEMLQEIPTHALRTQLGHAVWRQITEGV